MNPCRPTALHKSIAALLALAPALTTTSSHAADLFWDGTDTTANADGGGGTWDLSNLNWDTAATGGANSLWTNGDSAFFGGVAGTVTVGANLTANALTFSTFGYTLGGASTLTLGGATPTISVVDDGTAAVDATISAILGGSAGLTKTGAGTLVLSGANTYTGNITVNGGLLSVAGVTGTAAADLTPLGAAGARSITLDGGGFQLTGASWDPNANTKRFIIGAGGGSFDIAASIGLTLSDGAAAGDAQLSGTGNFTKTGAGFMILGRDFGFFSGVATVAQGALSLRTANASGTSNTVNITGGTLEFRNNTGTGFGDTVNVNGSGGIRYGRADTTGTSSVTHTTGPLIVNGAHAVTFGNIGGTGSGASSAMDFTGASMISGNASFSAVSGGTVRFTGSLDLGANTLSIVSSSGSSIQAGVATTETNDRLKGSGGVIVNSPGNGVFTLFGQNTFSGGIVLTAGRLISGSSSTLDGGGALVSGGFGTGTLTINGGLLRSTTSAVTNQANPVVIGGSFILGENNASEKEVSFSGPVTLNASPVITTNGQLGATRFTFSGNITDGGTPQGIVKAGPRSLALGGNNNFTGGVTVRNGSVVIRSDAALGTGTANLGDASTAGADVLNLLAETNVTVANNIVVNNNGAGSTIGGSGDVNATFNGGVTLNKNTSFNSGSVGGNAITFNGPITGTGNLTKSGPGLLVLTSSASDFGSGAANSINITGGTLAVTNDDALGNDANDFTLAAGTAFEARGTFSTTRDLAVSAGAGTITVTGANEVTWNGGIFGAGANLTKTGTGTLTLGNTLGTNNVGGVLIDAGTIKLAAIDQIGNATAVTVNAGATLSLNGQSDTISELFVNDGFVTFGGGSLVNTAGDLVLAENTNSAAPVSLTRNLISAVPSNTNVLSGPVTLDDSLANSIHTINVSNGSQAVDLEISGAIGQTAGANGITKIGSGTLLLSGASPNTYTGATVVNGGVLQLGKTAGVSAIIGDGNTGTIDLTVNTGATLSLLADEQIADTVTVKLDGATLVLGGNETIHELINNNGVFLGTGSLNTVVGDIFLLDGSTLGNLTLNRKAFFVGSTGSASITGTVTLNSANPNHAINVNDTPSGAELTISGTIQNDAGVNTITKAGPGTLVLSGNNTFGGAGQNVTAAQGAISISSNANLGHAANTLLLAGGALQVTTNLGGLTDGVTTRTINVGSTTLADATQVGNGTIEITGANTFTVTNAIGEDASGPLGAGRSLTKTGTGTLVLTTAGTYTGATIVAQGILSTANVAALGTSSTLALNAGTFRYTGATDALAHSVTLGSGATAGIIEVANAATTLSSGGQILGGTAGDTSLVIKGAGTFFANTGNAFAGNILVDGGRLAIAGPGTDDATAGAGARTDTTALGAAGARSITLSNGGVFALTTLDWNPDNNTKTFIIGPGGGTFDVPAGSRLQLDDGTGATAQLQIPAGLTATKTGAGVLVLGGATMGTANFGDIQANAGTIRVAHSTALGDTTGRTIINSGATLDFRLGGAGTVAEPLTLSGTGVDGNGALVNTANQTLNMSGPITLAGNASVNPAAGGFTQTMTISGDIGQSGTGSLTRVGEGLRASARGILVLSGNNTFTGGLNANGGITRITSANGAGAGPVRTGFGGRLEFDGATAGVTLTPTLAGNDGTLNAFSGVLDLSGTTITSPNAGVLVAGLSEGFLSGNGNLIDPNPAMRPSLSLLQANISGTNANGWADNRSYVYTGEIFVPDADSNPLTMETISFAENIDDGAHVMLNGTLVLTNTSSSTVTKSGPIELASGWHKIEIRLANGSSGAGASGSQTGSPTATNWNNTKGLGIDFGGAIGSGTEAADTLDANDYQTALADSGAMNVFRTATHSRISVEGGAEMKLGGFTNAGTVAFADNTGTAGTITLSAKGVPTQSTTQFLALERRNASTSRGVLNLGANHEVVVSNVFSIGNDAQLTVNGPGTLSVDGREDFGTNSLLTLDGGATVNFRGPTANWVGAGVGNNWSLALGNATLNIFGSFPNAHGVSAVNSLAGSGATGGIVLQDATTVFNINSGTLEHAITGAGTLRHNSTSTLTLGNAGNSIGGLGFGGNGGRLDLRAGVVPAQITLNGNLSTTNSSGTPILGTTAVGAGETAGTLNLAGGNRTFDINNGSAGADFEVTARIINGAITKTGAGLMRLRQANEFAGGVTINAGAIEGWDHEAAFGTGTITAGDGATWGYRHDGDGTTAAQTITFANNVNVTGASATVSVSRAGATATNKTIQAGDLTIGAATLNLSSNTTSYSLNFDDVNLTGNATFNPAATLRFVGAITDAAAPGSGFTKIGTGTMTILGTAANTYTGLTTLTAGNVFLGKSANTPAIGGDLTVAGSTVNMSDDGQIATTSNVTVSSGTLNFHNSGSIPNVGRNQTLATVALTGGTINTSTGAPAANSTVTVSGAVTQSGGTFNVNAGSTLAPASLTVNGGTFNMTGGVGAFVNAGSVTINTGVFRTSTGAPTVPNLMTVTGTLAVNGGDFNVNSGASVTANKVIFGGDVQNLHVVGGNSSLQVNELTVGAGGLEFTGTNLRMNKGTGSAKGSRVILNGDVTSFASANSAGLFGASTADTTGVREIQLNGTRTFIVADGAAIDDLRMQFEMVGTGGVTKTGPGQLRFDATNTYTGDTNVNQGTLAIFVSGSLSGSTNVNVASGATLDVSNLGGGYLQPAAQTLDVDGTVLGSVVVAGTLEGSGSVTGTLSGAGVVAPGDSPGVMTALDVNPSGGLDFSFEFTQLGSPTYANATASGNDVLRLTSATPFTMNLDAANTITADFSGFAGLAEGQTFRGGFFATTDFSASVSGASFAFTGLSGTVAGFDVSVVADNADFGGGPVAGFTVQLVAVPEPGSLVTLLGGLGTLLGLQRFRRRSA